MLLGLKLSASSSWLTSDSSESTDKRYRHTLVKESTARDDAVHAELKALLRRAHDDARYRLRKFLRDELDPLEPWDETLDPAQGYPELLDMNTLKGYFGEFWSGVLAENFSPFEESRWKVPMFLFRFHDLAFQELEMHRQTGQMSRAIVGRTGDDCVAFVLDGNDIVKVLVIEAKCTASHDVHMISEAHKKISQSNPVPVDLRKTIEVLKEDANNPDAQRWISALRRLFHDPSQSERFDYVSYLCGRSPVRGNQTSWISREQPHQAYTGGRKLETVETHMADVDDLLKRLYEKED